MALRWFSPGASVGALGGMDAADCILAGAMDGAPVVFEDGVMTAR